MSQSPVALPLHVRPLPSPKKNLIFTAILLVGFTSMKTTTKIFADALLLQDPITHTRRISLNAQAILPPQPQRSPFSSSRPTRTRTTTLRATNDNKQKQKKAQGVYVRPSGAIEKGSGFFVPGLEGPKVRLVIGLVLLVGTAVNHFLVGNVGSFGRNGLNNGGVEFQVFSFPEATAIAYCILILFQSAIEYAKEALPEGQAVSSSSKTSAKASTTALAGETEVLEQKWSSDDSSSEELSYRSRVQWAAASYMSMTPTTQIMLLARNKRADSETNLGGGVRYRLGSDSNSSSNSSNTGSGVTAALDELSQSKGGRIALPLTHPAVEALLGAPSPGGDDGGKLRTVILQRITDDSCWMVASDQLLAGYAAGDLKWLGKLAGYVSAP